MTRNAQVEKGKLKQRHSYKPQIAHFYRGKEFGCCHSKILLWHKHHKYLLNDNEMRKENSQKPQNKLV